MKGSLTFEKNWREKIDMTQVNVSVALERKMTLLTDDIDKLYYLHYQFKASNHGIENLKTHIKKIKLDIGKYEDILNRYSKYHEGKKYLGVK